MTTLPELLEAALAKKKEFDDALQAIIEYIKNNPK